MIISRIKSIDLCEYWHKVAIFGFLQAIFYWYRCEEGNY